MKVFFVLFGVMLFLFLGHQIAEYQITSKLFIPLVKAAGNLAILASPGDEVAVLVGAGDIAKCESPGDEATAALIEQIPGTVFTAGDEAYELGSQSNFNDCYAATWGRFKDRTIPATGNHEYFTEEAAPYFAYFGAAAGEMGKGFYSFDLGLWHIIVLNSNCSNIGGCEVGSPQEQWLRIDLAAHPATCTLAIWHHPVFSSGLHGNNSFMMPVWEELYAAGVDVVVNGHDHDYERFAPLDTTGGVDPLYGMREFVVGTGGASHYQFTDRLATSEVQNDDTFGVIKFTLFPTSYAWSFVPETGKSFTDAGGGQCHPAPPE